MVIKPSLVEKQEKSTLPPFRSLGYLNGTYYYYSRGEQAVVGLQAGGHGKKNLYRLAPHCYWVDQYKGKKDDFDENAAASALMDSCQIAGIFLIKRVRGRGVWMSDGDPVIHFGDNVRIGQKDYKPHLTPGKLIYELGEPLGFVIGKSLTDDEGKHLQDLIERLRWQTHDQNKWLTGWLVCAIMGGALSWRPHIWLTGGAQSGKSTLSSIINRILGANCLYIKSVSTEAGIRQTLKADCLAVVMDEAEREDERSHSRIQSVLTLARQSSSDDDARIVKGTPTGNALNYHIRSPFCLSSINSNLIQTADKGRFTNIELSSRKLLGDEWEAWKQDRDKLLTDEYVQKFSNRIFTMIPIIVANSKTLANAIERKAGDRRLGDQYGALLAGYLSLSSNEVLTDETAELEIELMDFVSEKEKAIGTNDQYRLLNKIMQHVTRIPKNQGYEDLSIAEMCEKVDANLHEESKRALAHLGIKIIGQQIAIASDNENLKHILKGSDWENNWTQTLRRIDSSEASKSNIYFTAGCKVRATLLPITEVIKKE